MKKSRIFAEKMVDLCKQARIASMEDAFPVCLTILPEVRKCIVARMSEPDAGSSVFNNEIDNEDFQSVSGRGFLTIPESVLIEGEQIKDNGNGVFFICFYPDGSSSGGIVTISVEEQFEFTFQVDMLTGVIRTIETGDGGGDIAQ